MITDRLAALGEELEASRVRVAWNINEAQQLTREAHEAGVPISTIATLLQVTRPTVYAWISEALRPSTKQEH